MYVEDEHRHSTEVCSMYVLVYERMTVFILLLSDTNLGLEKSTPSNMLLCGCWYPKPKGLKGDTPTYEHRHTETGG